jgi:hypothetical protein
METVGQLFAMQDGVATIEQLELAGVREGLRRSRLASGEWEKVSRQVIGLTGAPRTWRRLVRAAWLSAGPDCAISHCTAGRLHSFDGYGRRVELHVTVCGNAHRTSMPGVKVHRSDLLDERSCVRIDGILVVNKPVALVQIAGTDGRDACAKALDSVLRDGGPPVWIERVVSSWTHRGVKGASTVERLLYERIGQRLPRSWYQRLAKKVLKARNVTLVDEFPVKDPVTGRDLAQLDLADPTLQIGVECQSWEWHGSPSAQARDDARKRRLRLLGWEIVDLWWTDLTHIDDVLAELVYLIDQRRARPSA